MFLRTHHEVPATFHRLYCLDESSDSMPLEFQCYEIKFGSREIEEEQCIGLDEEKGKMKKLLLDLQRSRQQPRFDLYPIIAVTGDIGSGKTNFLKWTEKTAKTMGFRQMCFNYKFKRGVSLERAWTIVKSVAAQYEGQEVKILEAIGPDSNSYPLHRFNTYLSTNFIPDEREAYTKIAEVDMMVALVKACVQEIPILIILDNGEYIGRNTWQFLQKLVLSGAVCLVIAFMKPITRFKEMAFVDSLLRRRYATLRLGPVSDKLLFTLTCSFLNVTAVHKSFME